MNWKYLLVIFFTFQLLCGITYAGFFKDVGNLGQGVIDNVRGKESRDNKRLDKAIQKPIDAVKKPIEKADEKISTEWNEWREDKVDPIGDYIAAAYKYLKAGHKGNPDGFSAQSKTDISNPDIQVSLNIQLLQKLFSQLISKQIPLDKDNPSNGDYIYFDEIGVDSDAGRRIIILKIARGRLKFEFVTRSTLKIEGGTIEFLPKIRNSNGKLFLDLNARMTYLNVDDVLPMVERGIAHGINDHLKSKDGANGFISVDLTDKFGKSINLPTVDKDKIELHLAESAIFVEGKSIVFQANIGASK